MNKIILVKLLLVVNVCTAFSQTEFASYKPKDADVVNQNLFYEVRSKYVRPVAKDALIKAVLLRDFISGYPVNWITDYSSVNITVTGSDSNQSAIWINETLSEQQKDIITKAQIGDKITIDVSYTYQHPLTGVIEHSNINSTLTVAPHKHAQFIGTNSVLKPLPVSHEAPLKNYLKENGIKKVLENIPQQFHKGTVVFTVNKFGKVTNAIIKDSSGNTKMDKILLDSINNMPDWLPAENANGKKVKHDFELVVGTGGC